MNRALLWGVIVLVTAQLANAQQVAVLKYQGGGDWYSNPSSVTNLVNYSNEHINTKIALPYQTVEVSSTEIFEYPIVFMTGHGYVFFDDKDVQNLRAYLLSGGMLHIDDNYGLRPYIIKELQKVFPEKKMVKISRDHQIFKQPYVFDNGLPKIHEHDNKPPEAWGYFDKDRLMVLFTYETDLSDGWEDQIIHNDPPELREKALKMGTNIIYHAFKL